MQVQSVPRVVVRTIAAPKATFPLHDAADSAGRSDSADRTVHKHLPREPRRAWLPWATLSLFLFVWGLPPVKGLLKGEGGPVCVQAKVPPFTAMVVR